MNPPGLVEKSIAKTIQRPWPVLLFALILTTLSGIGMSQIGILTSRHALLPKDVDVSKRLDHFLKEFGAASDLIVVVEGAPRPDLEEYASDLARELETDPLVRTAAERVDLEFFLKNAYLLVPPDMLEQFGDLVDKLLSDPPPEQLRHWQDAWKSTEAWLDDPPELGEMDVDLDTAEEGLHLGLFVLEQWLRWLDEPTPPKSIAFNTMLARHGAESMASGYFASRDGSMVFIFVRPADASGEYDKLKPFIETVRAHAATLTKSWAAAGRPAPTIGLTGLPAASFEEYGALTRDILTTACTAAVLIILLILVWLRSFRWAVIVFVPMAVGVVWNIGLAYLLVGHLNMITSGFTAILFGLGVDYGIFMSTRIIEERQRVSDMRQAIARGAAASSRALLTAGGATVFIFTALAFVDFDGFSELGIVAACGVGMVLSSTFLLQPILFSWLPPRGRAARKEAPAAPPEPPAPNQGMNKSRLLSVFLLLLALAGAVSGGVLVFSIPFDYDVMSLLPEGSETAHYQRRMLAESDFQGEVLIFTAPDLPAARVLIEKARKIKTLARVQGITELFPEDAPERVRRARAMGQRIDASEYAHEIRALGPIELTPEHDQRILASLEKIQELLEDAEEQAFSAGHARLVKPMEGMLTQIGRIQAHYAKDPARAHARTQLYVQKLADAGKYALGVLAGWKDAKALQPADLPRPLRDRFFGADGSVAIYAFPAGDVYDQAFLKKMMAEVYAVSPDVTGFPTTHHVFSRMVVDSFRHGTLMALLVAIIWITLIFRRLRSLLLASLPLVIGGGWMMAAMALSGQKFNFANIIALPLVMGLAVDYGVWFAHRQLEFPSGTGWYVARRASTGILLAAGTTLAGLGAITLASYKGVASMGVALTIGLVCCVTAALFISPALAELLPRRKP